MRERTGFRLTGAQLKWIAMISMAADHVGARLLDGGLLKLLCRTAGRVSFPLFCFLLTEGFFHTHSVKQYGKRLLSFAFISELPFDLFFYDTFFYAERQNVLFTLFLGLCMLVCLEKAEREGQAFFGGLTVFERQAGTVLLFLAASRLLRCDYGTGELLLIPLFYLYRRGKCGIAAPTAFAALCSVAYFGAAALSALPISLYGGEKGRQEKRAFFYLFYPAHLLLLFIWKNVGYRGI